jgi:long-chain acyl-CoA synthetase
MTRTTNQRPWARSYPPGLSLDLEAVKAGTLVDLFEASARDFADRTAFESFGARLSYREIAGHARAIASGLQRLGLKKGDRVAVMAPSVMACAPILFGVIAGGFVLVPVDPAASPKDLTAQLNDSGARVIFVTETSAHIVCDALENLQTLERAIIMAPGDLAGWRGFFANVMMRRVRRRVKPYTLFATLPFDGFIEWGAGESPKPVDLTPDDVAILLYEGDDGRGAMLAHRNLLAGIAQCELWFGAQLNLSAPMVLAHNLPLSNSLALVAHWLFVFAVGGQQTLIADERDIGDVVKALRKSPPNLLALTGSLFGALAGCEALAKANLSQLILCLGANVAPDVAARWTDASGRAIARAYGRPQAPLISMSRFDDPQSGNIGYPLPGCDAQIRDNELWVQGPQTMAGYWNRPEESAQAMADGFVRIGASTALDESGAIALLD